MRISDWSSDVCSSDLAVAFGQAVVEQTFGEEAWLTMDNPVMGAEDFSYVLEKVPGAMFWLGASEAGSDWRQCCGLHSNHMVLDESVMEIGRESCRERVCKHV